MLMSLLHNKPIATQATIQAIIRIGLVVFLGGVVSYYTNYKDIESAVRAQLSISIEGLLQRDSIVFEQTKNIHKNFLEEFTRIYADKTQHPALLSDFDLLFYQHSDGSYTQRPGIFEGKPLQDGRAFPEMSATYAPDIKPDDDLKVRFALSFLLCSKYGSATKNQLFNIYGVVPEKGFPNFQGADVSKGFSYSEPDPLDLSKYEFFTRGFNQKQTDPFLTPIYYDASNNAWMTTYATPGPLDASGARKMLVCSDIVLDDLINRTAKTPIAGTHGLIFMDNEEGTLISDKKFQQEIINSQGKASIRSLNIVEYLPLLSALEQVRKTESAIVNTKKYIIAFGFIPGTQWVLAVVYPRDLMMEAFLENLLIIVAVGFFSLLVEIIVIRTVLFRHVSIPLNNLINKMQFIRMQNYKDESIVSHSGQNEIETIVKEFDVTVGQIEKAHSQLEQKVRERTIELNILNERLSELSLTDQLTGIGNRRHFDMSFESEWSRMRRSGKHISVIMGDVDWFKKYNDFYGHQGGDECLRKVSLVLKSSAQRGTDTVARYGGEEFIILLTKGGRREAVKMTESILQKIRELSIPHERSEFGIVTMSFGIASTEEKFYQNKQELLQAVDSALYSAKSKGRNRYEVDC